MSDHNAVKPLELSIILPTYNERENIDVFIPELAERFADVAHEIIVVDDSSPDGTADAVRILAMRFPQVRVLVRSEKTGIGSALRHGYQHASGEIILSSDTDLSFTVADLRRLYETIQNGYDLAIGSRHTARSGYETPNWKIRLKYLASRWGNVLLKGLFRMPVHDFSANCRAIRRDTWLKLDTRENTNFFLFEMIFLASSAGARIAEVPVVFLDRKFGQSKINHFIEIPKAFLKMLAFIFRRRMRRRND